jgi:hypothetical protein
MMMVIGRAAAGLAGAAVKLGKAGASAAAPAAKNAAAAAAKAGNAAAGQLGPRASLPGSGSGQRLMSGMGKGAMNFGQAALEDAAKQKLGISPTTSPSGGAALYQGAKLVHAHGQAQQRPGTASSFEAASAAAQAFSNKGKG